MTYSCGIFEPRDSSLFQASIAKYDRICRKLQLTHKDHVLEIGSGWGGFAIYAAKNYGCRITTTTISDQQFDLAKKRIENEGLSGRIEIIKQDYRNLKGEFDKLGVIHPAWIGYDKKMSEKFFTELNSRNIKITEYEKHPFP